MTLQFEEQEIDIAAAEAKIYNSQLKKWEQAISDLSKFELLSVYRKKVPVETRSALIAYKIRLGRDVDLEDVRQLEIAV